MANITMIEDAKMAARSKTARMMQQYKTNYNAPKRKQALGAMWLSMSQAQRDQMAQDRPEMYHEIMSLIEKERKHGNSTG